MSAARERGVDSRLLLLRLLAAFALGASLLLLYEHTRPSPTFCSEGGGCDTVRQSVWSHLLGIPTPIFGIAVFAGILVLSFLPRRQRLLVIAGLLSGAGAVGFIFLQAAVIRAWCVYCMFADVAALGIAILAVLFLRRPAETDRLPSTPVSVLAIGLGLLAPFLFGQATRAHGPANAEGTAAPPPVVVDKQSLPEAVAREQIPGVAVIVEWLDFQCPACRKQHGIFQSVLPSYGERVRLVRKNLPLPSHEYAAYAAAAYCCADEQHQGDSMADLLMTSSSLTPEACEELARKLGLDLSAFRECIASDRVKERLAREREEAISVGARALPTFYIGRERFEGGRDEDATRASVERALAESQGS